MMGDNESECGPVNDETVDGAAAAGNNNNNNDEMNATGEEPAAEEPAADEPAAEEPCDEEPAGEEQAGDHDCEEQIGADQQGGGDEQQQYDGDEQEQQRSDQPGELHLSPIDHQPSEHPGAEPADGVSVGAAATRVSDGKTGTNNKAEETASSPRRKLNIPGPFGAPSPSSGGGGAAPASNRWKTPGVFKKEANTEGGAGAGETVQQKEAAAAPAAPLPIGPKKKLVVPGAFGGSSPTVNTAPTTTPSWKNKTDQSSSNKALPIPQQQQQEEKETLTSPGGGAGGKKKLVLPGAFGKATKKMNGPAFGGKLSQSTSSLQNSSSTTTTPSSSPNAAGTRKKLNLPGAFGGGKGTTTTTPATTTTTPATPVSSTTTTPLSSPSAGTRKKLAVPGAFGGGGGKGTTAATTKDETPNSSKINDNKPPLPASPRKLAVPGAFGGSNRWQAPKTGATADPPAATTDEKNEDNSSSENKNKSSASFSSSPSSPTKKQFHTTAGAADRKVPLGQDGTLATSSRVRSGRWKPNVAAAAATSTDDDKVDAPPAAAAVDVTAKPPTLNKSSKSMGHVLSDQPKKLVVPGPFGGGEAKKVTPFGAKPWQSQKSVLQPSATATTTTAVDSEPEPSSSSTAEQQPTTPNNVPSSSPKHKPKKKGPALGNFFAKNESGPDSTVSKFSGAKSVGYLESKPKKKLVVPGAFGGGGGAAAAKPWQKKVAVVNPPQPKQDTVTPQQEEEEASESHPQERSEEESSSTVATSEDKPSDVHETSYEVSKQTEADANSGGGTVPSSSTDNSKSPVKAGLLKTKKSKPSLGNFFSKTDDGQQDNLSKFSGAKSVGYLEPSSSKPKKLNVPGAFGGIPTGQSTVETKKWQSQKNVVVKPTADADTTKATGGGDGGEEKKPYTKEPPKFLAKANKFASTGTILNNTKAGKKNSTTEADTTTGSSPEAQNEKSSEVSIVEAEANGGTVGSSSSSSSNNNKAAVTGGFPKGKAKGPSLGNFFSKNEDGQQDNNPASKFSGAKSVGYLESKPKKLAVPGAFGGIPAGQSTLESKKWQSQKNVAVKTGAANDDSKVSTTTTTTLELPDAKAGGVPEEKLQKEPSPPVTSTPESVRQPGKKLAIPNMFSNPKGAVPQPNAAAGGAKPLSYGNKSKSMSVVKKFDVV